MTFWLVLIGSLFLFLILLEEAIHFFFYRKLLKSERSTESVLIKLKEIWSKFSMKGRHILQKKHQE
ncbi:hypothetical protein [Cytobacillus gottheilii]|uniref:hypothetical protein n=1 Tax=Cytobacillus gottheilii TaxID=859144 RepID=UPI0009B95213|nr:hypothetical protein [Cytobacillus gottheilii]